MCGFAGVLSENALTDVSVVRKMIDGLVHRGPDAFGVVELGQLVLGHRRLSVIDVSEENNQPLTDTGGSFVVAFNGEIYNFQDIRKELVDEGARFRTNGDTEVILEAYKRWGEGCLSRFNGMFAFALWDVPRQRLLLARDRLGEKPLFYAELRKGGLVFASEPRVLRFHPDVGCEVDTASLVQYLTLNYSIGERSLIRGIRLLPPAHYLIVNKGKRPILTRYWDLASVFRNKRPFGTEKQAAEELRALVDDAVRLRLVSDVPLGAFLSGGVDSSAVASSMAQALPASQVQTFTMGFGSPTFDEVDKARAVASLLGLNHKERIAEPDSERLVQGIVAAADEPLADSSAIPMYLLSEFAREYVTVVLSGDGADECLIGYETYIADKLHHALTWLPRSVVRSMHRAADVLLPVSFSKVSLDYKIRHFLAGLHKDFPHAHASWRNIFSARELSELMQDWWGDVAESEESDAFYAFEPHFEEVRECHYIDQASYTDIKTWLADDILVKVDRATMAHSLEARAPLLDHRLVEFAASLPVEWKLKGMRKKHLFKQSLRGRLPDRLLDGKKQGFNAPVSQWFEGPLRSFARDTLSSTALLQWIRPEAVERLWCEHEKRRRDNGLKLFGLVCFALWLNQL